MISLQDGSAGYGGEQDLSISSMRYGGSNTTGVTFRNSADLLAYTISGSGGYTAKALLRFDLGSVPRNATVLSAQLELTVESWFNGMELNGGYLQNAWDARSGKLGWSNCSDTQPWVQTGIGPGDLVPGRSFQLTGLTSGGTQKRSVALDPAQVQAWLRDPSTNHGIVLSNPATDRVLRIHSSAHGTQDQRPRLTVTYR